MGAEIQRIAQGFVVFTAGDRGRHICRRVGGIDLEQIIPVATQRLIGTAHRQRIVAGTTVEQVITRTAGQRIVARAAIQRVVAQAAIDDIVAGARINAVIAATGRNGIVARPRCDDVGAFGHNIAICICEANVDCIAQGRAIYHPVWVGKNVLDLAKGDCDRIAIGVGVGCRATLARASGRVKAGVSRVIHHRNRAQPAQIQRIAIGFAVFATNNGDRRGAG